MSMAWVPVTIPVVHQVALCGVQKVLLISTDWEHYVIREYFGHFEQVFIFTFYFPFYYIIILLCTHLATLLSTTLRK